MMKLMEEGHWLIKKLPWPILRGHPLGGWSRQNKRLGGRGSELRLDSSPLWGRHHEAPTQDGFRIKSSR